MRRQFLLVLALVFILISPAKAAEALDPYAFEVAKACYPDSLCYHVLREINDSYVDPVDIKKLAEIYKAKGMKAVFDELDAHSVYVTREERIKREAHDADQKGPFGGVGLPVREVNKEIVVAEEPDDNTPASQADIREGDVISAVNGKKVSGMSLNDVVSLIRGQVGTEVTLTLRREERKGEPIEIVKTLKRAQIKVENVVLKQFGEFAHIKLGEFENGAAKKINEVYSALSNVKGLVLDLRGNLGGLLHEANKVSALFLDPSKLIEKITQRHDEEEHFSFHYVLGSDRIKTPLVVLVDAASASSSEIVAAAIQDNERGVIIGMPTFGKALVQTRYGDTQGDDWSQILNGDYFSLTTGRIYRPSGRSLQGKGVLPDFVITKKDGEDLDRILKEQLESGRQEKSLEKHIKGEEEGKWTKEEQDKVKLLKKDRQLQFALEILKIISNQK